LNWIEREVHERKIPQDFPPAPKKESRLRRWRLGSFDQQNYGARLREKAGSQSGIVIGGATGSVNNNAEISGGAYGVSLAEGGTVVNDPVGYIYGGTAGVVLGGAGLIENDGTISVGSGGYALELTAGGTVFNDLHATLSGGLKISGGAAYVYNSDLITAAQGAAVVSDAGGIVANARGAQIAGATGGIDLKNAAGTVINLGMVTGSSGIGADLEDGGTVIDAGTIAGGNGTAIAFGGTGSNLLILESSLIVSAASSNG
jgi:hypothetical protein